MKNYIVLVIQLMIWSGYTLIEWLSKHDQGLYNFLMFCVFLYIAIISANTIVRSLRKTFILTLSSLVIYTFIHTILNFI
ncbi:hypothetical protein J2S07_002171 [Robertmurraya andreesenii]|uniref:Group-specific protein n=1 Tax=Anoxybacillus andreesenii TaxID=1325932 RepID=A0ABT9V4H6_9BACL|nr:hypothetical protein [Robertmurraya andreesenii]